MAKRRRQKYSPVPATPVKSFFVQMLTRDISLGDAILDLLDNCVDGILRSKKRSRSRKPYAGFKAEIEFKKGSFMISDNCGGIPWSLHDYAFRMGRASGRPSDKPGTVGVYGIGMKRAIFKMGKNCLISTKNGRHEYDVQITPKWIADEEEWEIPVTGTEKSRGEDGTTIIVGDLYSGIVELFNTNARAFKADLERMVATHYAFIINKGLEVRINGDLVKPRPTKLIFSKDGRTTRRIQPFIFKARTDDGVDVFLAVGFTRAIPTEEEVTNEQAETRYSSVGAGWTVLCNDRAVLYCDRSELTGWGEAGVPRYHNQFIAISGIVEFRCDDASKLPTTTTKRGINASLPLYLQIKNKMREGMRIFINYTNKWKGSVEESKKHIEGAEALPFDQVKEGAETLQFSSTRKSVPKGHQYKPTLPMPRRLESRKRRISFVKNIEEVKCVAEHLFEDEDTAPSVVGEQCFDLILKETRR